MEDVYVSLARHEQKLNMLERDVSGLKMVQAENIRFIIASVMLAFFKN